VIRRHLVIERGGIRFGLFGVLGKEAIFYTTGGAVTFSDAIETSKEMVKALRETEKVDVVIALSHGGLEKGKDGRYIDGEDVRLSKAVPGIDVVISGHSHRAEGRSSSTTARRGTDRKESRNLGELTITLDGGKLTVESYRLHPIDDTIVGDRAIVAKIEQLKKAVTGAAFASRGYRVDQPLAIAPRDLPNTFTDIAAGTLLANLVTDPSRATKNHQFHRQRNDALRSYSGKVGCADGLRRVRRGAPRRRCR
jgi:5'-nucleotidase